MWNLSTESSIKRLCSGLRVGETKYYKCIFCNAEHENKLSITKFQDCIKYHCFRAKCGAKGIIYCTPGAMSAWDLFTPRIYTKPLVPVPPAILKQYLRGTELRDVGGIRYAPEDNGVLLPIHDSNSFVTGHILRKLSGMPKYSTYFRELNPHSYYLSRMDNNALVIVEDILSAIKVSKFQNSMALLGTNLTSHGLSSIVREDPSSIVVMLDPGAEDAATKIASKLSSMFSVRVVFNNKDPKYIPYTELVELI